MITGVGRRHKDIASGYTDAIDDSAAQALVEMLRGIDDESRKSALVLQLTRIAHPALTTTPFGRRWGRALESERRVAAGVVVARASEFLP